uniref:Lipocalin 9 n=1 Tax=Aotus nancymaae TaxID=37293 RepID=A0A2K5ETM0_AOTNA
MALLLRSLGLGLISAQEFSPNTVVQRNDNMARVGLVWYSIFMASDDLNGIKDDGDLRVFVQNTEHLKNGSLRFDFQCMVQGECGAMAVVWKKTENGEYSINYEGENTVAVSETDYNLLITSHLQNFRNGSETNVLALYETCRKYGLGSPLGVPSQKGHRCPPLLWSGNGTQGAW